MENNFKEALNRKLYECINSELDFLKTIQLYKKYAIDRIIKDSTFDEIFKIKALNDIVNAEITTNQILTLSKIIKEI